MTTEGAPSALSKATAGLKSQVAVVLYKETGGVTINGFHYNFRRRIEEIDAIDYRCNQRSIKCPGAVLLSNHRIFTKAEHKRPCKRLLKKPYK